MTILNQLASSQGRRDDILNQELAKELVESEDTAGLTEIAKNLFNEDKNIQSDCIKVLYEAGYLKPEMITEYAEDFLKLLRSGNNRLVWGAMIALTVVAPLKADVIHKNLNVVYESMKRGSVITIDNGIKVLAIVASKKQSYCHEIFPCLINHLKTCRPKEVGQHAESVLVAVNPQNKQKFLEVLKEREISLVDSQLKRVQKLYKILARLE